MKPCLNCTKRGQAASCEYAKQDLPRPQPGGQQGLVTLQGRVRQLEDMVKALLNNQTNSEKDKSFSETSSSYASEAALANNGGFTHPTALSPCSQLDDPNVPKASMGKFTRENDETSFVGSEHWEAVLESIADLKIDLETPDTTEMHYFKPQLLFGTNRASRSEIKSSIPSKPICDMLISRWFKKMDMAPMVIHVPTFMKQYDQMFKDPDEVPLMWIGLLFSLLGLGSCFYAMAGEELPIIPDQFSSMWDMCSFFCDRTAQCLVEVNYLRPKRFSVETLIFYYALEKFRGRDIEFGTYVLLGIVIRVAMRLGYHRDASHFPSISPFDGEMRRRVWCIIRHLDLINSAQVGLPRMVRDEETDTAEPKNLLDSDFNEDITEVPHPRPSTDVTVVAFAIFQYRLTRHLGLIVDQINSITPPSYTEVMALDLKLFDIHAALPPYLTMRPLSLSITDDTIIILRRYAIEAFFQKSRCLLHRKYLIPGKSDSQFRYSRTTSVDAAMKLLDVQSILHDTIRPGGQFCSEEWRTSALINQDYILAAMVISLDLAWDTRIKDVPADYEDEIEAIWPKSKRLQTLKRSYDIWCESTTTSALAAKAAKALKSMLKDVDTSNSTATVTPTTLFSNAEIASGMFTSHRLV
jgi:hypothetical protein